MKRLILGSLFVSALVVFIGLAMPAASQVPDARAQLAQVVQGFRTAAATQASGRIRIIARLSEAAVSRSRQAAMPPRDAPGAYVAASLATSPSLIGSAQNQLLRRMAGLGATSGKRIEGLPMIVLDVNGAQLDALMASGEVSAIFEDTLARPTLDVSGPLVGADAAHARGARGAGTTIAILDTGVLSVHEFLSGRVLNGACFSTNSSWRSSETLCPDGSESSTEVTAGNPCIINGCDHGTHVAGIAAGRRSPNFNADGIAPDAKVLPVLVFSKVDGEPRSFTSDQVAGLQYVRQHASALNIVAVNLSLGNSEKYTSSCDGSGAFVSPMAELVNQLRTMGVATAIAAGNDDFNNGVSSPACISSAVTVGASGDDDTIADFSNHSSLVDLMAPGVRITSAVSGGGFNAKSGTSMAAPHVAGSIALIRSKVAMSVDQMVALLQATGDPVTGQRNTPARVRINIGRAITQIVPAPPPDGRPENEIDRSRLIRSSTGRCLDAHAPTAGRNGGRVQVWSCNGQPQQHWTALTNGALRNEAAGFCLDVEGLDITHDGASPRVWACNTSPQQRWTVRPAEKTITLSSGLCLDARQDEQFTDGGRVIIHRCQGQSNQKWRFVAPDVLAREANVRTNAGLCVEVRRDEVATSGGHVEVRACSSEAQQRWSYDRTTRALRLASGLCLDADLAQVTTPGGRVQAWACNGQRQQQWTPLANGALRNAAGLCLDVNLPEQTTNGGRVQLWNCNGQPQQRFTSTAF